MKRVLELNIQCFTEYIRGGFLWFLEDQFGLLAIGSDLGEALHNYETAVASEVAPLVKE